MCWNVKDLAVIIKRRADVQFAVGRPTQQPFVIGGMNNTAAREVVAVML
jgi:hypothetical protein